MTVSGRQHLDQSSDEKNNFLDTLEESEEWGGALSREWLARRGANVGK